MATIAIGRGNPWNPRDDRAIYAVWLGIMWAGLILGFGLDIPLQFLRQTPAAPFIVLVHGAVFTGWMLILSAQILLVQSGRIALHRRLGIGALCFAVLMAPLGLTAALAVQAQTLHLPSANPQFLALNFMDIGGFAAFTAAGYFLRRDAASHKRMMMLAMVALADPGFARIAGNLLPPSANHDFWSFLILTFYGNFVLIALMAGWDLWKRGTLNRPFAIGAGLLVASEFAVPALCFSPSWKHICVALIRAWGYAV